MVRTPPHILIITPESLYILLTTPSGRKMFRTVQTVIVDEIHTLVGSKRGVHLALSLKRLQQLADGAPLIFARIPSSWVVLERGLPALLVEDGGACLTTMAHANDELTQRALNAWLAHAGRFEPRIQVLEWNAAPVLHSPGQVILEATGFRREYPGMRWGD